MTVNSRNNNKDYRGNNNRDNPVISTSTVLVLNRDQYKKLEAAMPKGFVTGQTTDIQAGFHLGIEFVLRMLREGFTTDV